MSGAIVQGTASESALVALLAARARVLEGRSAKDNEKLVAYCSDQVRAASQRVLPALCVPRARDAIPRGGATRFQGSQRAALRLPAGENGSSSERLAAWHMQAHSSIQKACMVAWVPHLRLLAASAEDDYAMDPTALEAAIEADLAAGLLPCYVCATIGTTSSCAVDPLEPIGRIARRHKLWCGSHGGACLLLPSSHCVSHLLMQCPTVPVQQKLTFTDLSCSFFLKC